MITYHEVVVLCDAGVLNGIDMQEWNPEADPKIYQTYSMADLKKGKTANKLALQKELSLAERPEVRVRVRVRVASQGLGLGVRIGVAVFSGGPGRRIC